MHLPHGRCVGIPVPEQVDEPLLAALVTAERAHAAALPPYRRATWIAGRVALRAALADLGVDPGPILVTNRGAPALPDGVTGSISHKRLFAVALAGTHDGTRLGVAKSPYTLGVDLEVDGAPRADIGPRVLTSTEMEAVAAAPPEARARALMLRFSAKEAIYKALDPYLGRYIGFKEVTVHPADDGSATVILALAPGEGPFVVDVSWVTVKGHILTTARVQPDAKPR